MGIDQWLFGVSAYSGIDGAAEASTTKGRATGLGASVAWQTRAKLPEMVEYLRVELNLPQCVGARLTPSRHAGEGD